MKKGVTRVTLDLETDLYVLVVTAAKREESTKAWAIRRALKLADHIDEQMNAGWKLKLEKDGETKEIVFL